jgi:Ala-tRNA(Pro) deacylase
MLAKLKQLLDQNGVHYSLIVHHTAYTAQEVAAAEHVPGREHAKVTVIKVGKDFAMAVMPAQKKIDFVKLAAVLGDRQIRLAEEKEFSGVFPECEPGAMPPFGHLFGLPVIVDLELEKDQNIAFQAGTHVESIRMKYADFKRLEKPRTADFTAK